MELDSDKSIAVPRRTQKGRFSRIPKLFVILGLVVLLMGTVGGVYLYFERHHNPFPPAIRQQAHFPLYYPRKTPANFVISSDSFSYSNQDVLYYFTYENDKRLVFSIQKAPNNFDVHKFETDWFRNSSTVSTPLGSGVIGLLNRQQTVSISTENVWVLVTAPNGIDQNLLRTIIKSLHKY